MERPRYHRIILPGLLLDKGAERDARDSVSVTLTTQWHCTWLSQVVGCCRARAWWDNLWVSVDRFVYLFAILQIRFSWFWSFSVRWFQRSCEAWHAWILKCFSGMCDHSFPFVNRVQVADEDGMPPRVQSWGGSNHSPFRHLSAIIPCFLGSEFKMFLHQSWQKKGRTKRKKVVIDLGERDFTLRINEGFVLSDLHTRPWAL